MRSEGYIVDKVSEALMKKEPRVVFLYGAGASMPSGMPSSDTLKKRLFNEKLNLIIRALKIKELAERVGVDFNELRGGNIKDIAFEQLMTIASEYHGQENIAEWLERQIPDIYRNEIRYLPSIVYEFVSHLMSNDLVNYVVNLNYDEILDKAIDDEIGKGKCLRIVTMEDFERLSLTAEKDWKNIGEYFIFKPHGTRNMRCSFRYRVEDVFRFEEHKANVLKKVCEDSILILIGYGAEDFDFKNLLVDLGFDSIKNIVVVRRNPIKTVKNLRGYSKDKILSYPGLADEFFEKLAEQLYETQDYRKYYTKVTRHFIRAEINKLVSPADYNLKEEIRNQNIKHKEEAQKKALEGNPLFFEELNLLIEILIYCFKVRGLFASSVLMVCRRITSALEAYTNKKRELEESKKKEIRERAKSRPLNPIEYLLGELCDENGNRRGILRYKQNRRMFDTRWYYIPVVKEDPSNKHENSGKNTKEEESVFMESAKKAVDFLFANYLELFANSESALKEMLASYFSNLPDGFDYDLEKDVKLFSLPFRNVKRIVSRKEFRERTEEIMQEVERGGSLYILSPSAAEWFEEWAKNWTNSKLNFSPQQKIKILINKDVWIMQDSVQFEHIKKIIHNINKFLGSLTTEVECVPNVRYGLTLTFKETDGDITIGKALIFYREGKASAFTPMHIDEGNIEDQSSSDICRLKKYFDEELFNQKQSLTLKSDKNNKEEIENSI